MRRVAATTTATRPTTTARERDAIDADRATTRAFGGVLGLPTSATTTTTTTRWCASVDATARGMPTIATLGRGLATIGGAGATTEDAAAARTRGRASGTRERDDATTTGIVARAYAQLAQYPRVLLPTTDAAVYVNAKQYDAIVRRRHKRARENATRTPGVVNAKHPSRSAHAKNRIRGKNGKYLTRDELLRGLGGPEGRARAQAREREIAEREAKRVQRAATRAAAEARARAQRAAAEAVRAAKKSRK